MNLENIVPAYQHVGILIEHLAQSTSVPNYRGGLRIRKCFTLDTVFLTCGKHYWTTLLIWASKPKTQSWMHSNKIARAEPYSFEVFVSWDERVGWTGDSQSSSGVWVGGWCQSDGVISSLPDRIRKQLKEKTDIWDWTVSPPGRQSDLPHFFLKCVLRTAGILR